VASVAPLYQILKTLPRRTIMATGLVSPYDKHVRSYHRRFHWRTSILHSHFYYLFTTIDVCHKFSNALCYWAI